jgi:hypothetical protein
MGLLPVKEHREHPWVGVSVCVCVCVRACASLGVASYSAATVGAVTKGVEEKRYVEVLVCLAKNNGAERRGVSRCASLCWGTLHRL